MTDLFTPKPQPGVANGKFLVAISQMTKAQIAKIKASDFPDASPRVVMLNVRLHTNQRSK